MDNCERCNKGERVATVTTYGTDGLATKQEGLCRDCYAKHVKEVESRKECRKCVYFEYPECFCSKINLKLSPQMSTAGPAASPLDYLRIHCFQAEECVHYLTPEEYERKAIKGEIPGKEKEIIKEKEVIVKVRCPYCHNLYDETLNRCPHCGGGR